MKMPFGKYKGQELDEVPDDYLQWALENCTMTFALTEEMEAQLRAKSGEGIVRKQDPR